MKEKTITRGFIISFAIGLSPILIGLLGVLTSSILGCNWSFSDRTICPILNIGPLIDITKDFFAYGLYLGVPTALFSLPTWAFIVFARISIEKRHLLKAAAQNDVAKIEMLASYVSDIDYSDRKGNTGLMIAAQNGHLDSVKKFLEFGTNPELININEEDALDFATKEGHSEIVDLLTKKNAL